MENAVSYSWRLIARCALVAALGSAMPATAQTVSGQARAIKTSVVDPLGGTTTTALADTGTLSGSTDAREASAPTGSVPSVIAGNTLHATTNGWPDQVKRSEEHTSELQSRLHLVCRLLLEKKNKRQ